MRIASAARPAPVERDVELRTLDGTASAACGDTAAVAFVDAADRPKRLTTTADGGVGSSPGLGRPMRG